MTRFITYLSLLGLLFLTACPAGTAPLSGSSELGSADQASAEGIVPKSDQHIMEFEKDMKFPLCISDQYQTQTVYPDGPPGKLYYNLSTGLYAKLLAQIEVFGSWQPVEAGIPSRVIYAPQGQAEADYQACDTMTTDTSEGETFNLTLSGLMVAEGTLQLYFYDPKAEDIAALSPCSEGLAPIADLQGYEDFKAHEKVRYLGAFNLIQSDLSPVMRSLERTETNWDSLEPQDNPLNEDLQEINPTEPPKPDKPNYQIIERLK